MRTCTKCGTVLPLQSGKGRRRTLCEACSPPRRRSAPPLRPVAGALAPAGGVAAAVAAELAEIGMSDGHLGRLALALAERIDTGQEPGAALAALTRQLRDTMHAARAAAPQDEGENLLEALRRQRAERLQGLQP